MKFSQLPALGAPLDTGIFAGVTTAKDGTHHAVVLLRGNGTILSWKNALQWAKDQGGDLPTRPAAAMLFANVKSALPESGWHWTNEACNDSYAWGCGFYDGYQTGSLPVLCPEIADTCIVVNGVAKTYAMTGWRVGWLIGPTDMVKATTNLQSHATSNVANVSQRAALAAVAGDLSAVAEMKVAFDRRRKTMVEMLNAIDGVVCPTPHGAFYAYPSVTAMLGKEYDGRQINTSAELAEYILEKAEVAVVPGEAFGSPGYLRLSYALGDDDLVEGIARIQNLFA